MDNNFLQLTFDEKYQKILEKVQITEQNEYSNRIKCASDDLFTYQIGMQLSEGASSSMSDIANYQINQISPAIERIIQEFDSLNMKLGLKPINTRGEELKEKYQALLEAFSHKSNIGKTFRQVYKEILASGFTAVKVEPSPVANMEDLISPLPEFKAQLFTNPELDIRKLSVEVVDSAISTCYFDSSSILNDSSDGEFCFYYKRASAEEVEEVKSLAIQQGIMRAIEAGMALQDGSLSEEMQTEIEDKISEIMDTLVSFESTTEYFDKIASGDETITELRPQDIHAIVRNKLAVQNSPYSVNNTGYSDDSIQSSGYEQIASDTAESPINEYTIQGSDRYLCIFYIKIYSAETMQIKNTLLRKPTIYKYTLSSDKILTEEILPIDSFPLVSCYGDYKKLGLNSHRYYGLTSYARTSQQILNNCYTNFMMSATYSAKPLIAVPNSTFDKNREFFENFYVSNNTFVPLSEADAMSQRPIMPIEFGATGIQSYIQGIQLAQMALEKILGSTPTEDPKTVATSSVMAQSDGYEFVRSGFLRQMKYYTERISLLVAKWIPLIYTYPIVLDSPHLVEGVSLLFNIDPSTKVDLSNFMGISASNSMTASQRDRSIAFLFSAVQNQSPEMMSKVIELHLSIQSGSAFEDCYQDVRLDNIINGISTPSNEELMNIDRDRQMKGLPTIQETQSIELRERQAKIADMNAQSQLKQAQLQADNLKAVSEKTKLDQEAVKIHTEASLNLIKGQEIQAEIMMNSQAKSIELKHEDSKLDIEHKKLEVEVAKIKVENKKIDVESETKRRDIQAKQSQSTSTK